MSSTILYLKADQNILLQSDHVQVRDVAEVSCSEKSIENKVKTLRVPTGQIHGPGRYVFSVMDLIKVIQQEYPSLEITSIGETDFILTVEKDRQSTAIVTAVSWGKTILVCLLSFFGAAFSIMAFNNDIGITTLFGQLYECFTGKASDGFTLLEVSYSVGVGLGILIFFHHFTRKKGLSDPTPLEVEMRTYEDDVNKTTIESNGRNRKKYRENN